MKHILYNLLGLLIVIDNCCPLETLLRRVKPLENPDPIFNPYPTPETGPYFDLHRTVNVTALKGVTTHLVCRVKRLANNTVSWIRMSDTTLLTVGRYTYTTDLRFEAFHSPHTDDWIIRLKNPKIKDSGVYGCQISTTPHRTHNVFLTVKEPTTHITGGPDMFVDVGSMVNLSCVVANTEKPPEKVVWIHNGKEISFRGPRNGVSVITEKAEETTIHLLMQGANPGDSGIYQCEPSNAPRAKIKVHILKGNQVAGLQTNSASSLSALFSTSFAILWLLLVVRLNDSCSSCCSCSSVVRNSCRHVVRSSSYCSRSSCQTRCCGLVSDEENTLSVSDQAASSTSSVHRIPC